MIIKQGLVIFFVNQTFPSIDHQPFLFANQNYSTNLTDAQSLAMDNQSFSPKNQYFSQIFMNLEHPFADEETMLTWHDTWMITWDDTSS
jgi:hypothetical protein